MQWMDWSGYYAVRSYDTYHEREYFALRHAAGLIDVSPLCKYEVTGPDAAAFLARVLVKDARKLKVGRVTYLCWCDDDGKIIDDGTLSRLEEDHFRLTSNLPAIGWLLRQAGSDRVTIEESTARLGALALQGPNSREILKQVAGGEIGKLRFFSLTRAKLDGVDVQISRTGYTGDLGYEIWVDREDGPRVWDAVTAAGKPYRIEPTGLTAMDVSRIEAGFILCGIDYFSTNRCLLASRKSSPYEVGLGWTVKLDREPFIGQAALREEKARGSKWALVGLEYDWDEWEAVHAAYGLPPQVPGSGWRVGVPVYDSGGGQIGQATSGAWSPLLKKNLALATLRVPYGKPGTRVRVEVTVEYERRHVTATVVKTPFFNPERKRS